MPKILGTADWQLGKAMSKAGEKAEFFREQLFLTAEKIVHETAVESDADLIVICGDIFEQPDAPWTLIERTAKMLLRSEKPIHIIAGNHDALDSTKATSLWKLDKELGDQSKVVIHKKREKYRIEELDCTIFPGVLSARFDPSDQVSWIPKRTKDDGFRIGLFHGAIAQFGNEDDFRVKNLEPTLAIDKDLDIVLLGDWHQPKGEEENTMYQPKNKIWYTWAPEAQKISDEKIGRVILCELTKDRDPNCTPIEVGKNRFVNFEISFAEDDPEKGFEKLSQYIAEKIHASDDNHISVRIIASGWLSKSNHNRLDSEIAKIQEDFKDIRFKDKVSILLDDLGDSEDLIRQISDAISDSNETSEIRELAIKLLHKYARQELGGE